MVVERIFVDISVSRAMDQARLDRACFTIQIRLDYNLLAVNLGFFLQAAHIDGQNYF